MDEQDTPMLGVLGPTVLDGHETPPALQARLLAGLAVAGRGGARTAWLEQIVWPDGAPASHRASLQNLVSRVRRRLGDEAVVWSGNRYRLGPSVTTDVMQLLRLLAALDLARERDDPQALLAMSTTAISLFRGEPYADLEPEVARGSRRQLVEILRSLEETRAEAQGALGRWDEAIASWRSLVEHDPHHEGRWARLLLALQAAGRRAEALKAYQEVRRRLNDDLGLEPGAVLAAAHQGVIEDRQPEPIVAPAGHPVARPDLLARIRTAFGASGFVALTGPPGIGKSTVAAAVTDERGGATVVRIQCRENPWTALQPIQDLLTALGPALRDLDPPPGPAATRLLAGPGGGLPDAPISAVGLVDEVSDALIRTIGTRPVTLVLDDAGYAGPTTWRVVERLHPTVAGLRTLVVVSGASSLPEALRGEAVELRIPGLDAEQVEQLVTRLLRRPGQVTPLAAWVHRATAGNPLFVIEVIGELHRRGHLTMGPHGLKPPEHVPVSASLRQVVSQRLAELPGTSRRGLDVVAILGEHAEVASVHALGVKAGDLTAAVTAEVLVEEGGRLRFVHELLRRAARELVPPGRRLELEMAVADLFEERGVPASVVARHRLAAAEIDPLAAAGAALRAAREATDEQAFDEAITWADRGRGALGAAVDVASRISVELAVVAAEARRLAGAPDHAEPLLEASERALELGDAVLRRQAVLSALRLGACCQPGPEQARAVLLADRALGLEDDPVDRAVVHASASLTHSMVDATACRRHFEAALRIVEEEAAAREPAVLVEVLPYAYLGLGLPDDLGRRSDAAERLAAAAEAVGDPAAAFEARHLRFSAALQRGDAEAMRQAHAEMVQLAPRAADAGRRWALAYQQAALLQLDGDLDRAEAAVQTALEIGTTVAAARAVATWASQTLELRRLQGRLVELAPVLQGFVEDPAALPAWRTAAALVFATDRPEEARQLVSDLATDLDALPADFARGAALITLGRAIVVLGAADDAPPVLELLRPWAHLMSWQGTTTYGPYGEVVAALGELVGDVDAVEAGRRGAAEVTGRLGSPVYG